MDENEKKDDYIRALEDELRASIERENSISGKEMTLGAFIVEKIKRTKFFEKMLSEPDSKIGKLVRAPRSAYRIIKNPEVRKRMMQKKTVNSAGVDIEVNERFLDPWMIETKRRYEIAEQALRDGKKVALYYVDKPDNSTFRYRCYNVFKATLGSSKWQAVYFFKNEFEVMKKILPQVDLIIMGRQSGLKKTVKELIDLVHSSGKKIGMDIDDLVFDMKYFDIMMNTIGENANRSYWMTFFAGVQAVAERADYFIVTNQFLSNKIQESFDKPCKIIRNSLNEEQIFASRVYTKMKDERRNNQFVIGYFSGSPTHRKDLDEALPEVVKFLKKYKETTLNVVGYMRFSDKYKKFIEEGRIKMLPIVDFRKLQREMSEVDVNIAPLVINDFTNCKSELKFFEAAAVETTTIASPTFAFKNSITDGVNGFLAKPGEWYDKLEYLYNNSKHNYKIAKKAKEYALKHYYGKEFLEEVEETYEYFVD